MSTSVYFQFYKFMGNSLLSLVPLCQYLYDMLFKKYMTWTLHTFYFCSFWSNRIFFMYNFIKNMVQLQGILPDLISTDHSQFLRKNQIVPELLYMH